MDPCGACIDITENINNSLDDSFTKQFGVFFQESFQKCYNFEKKKSCEEKRSMKRKIIRETVNTINVSTAVERLYGTRQSLKGWDANRKKKSFESVPDAKNRTCYEKLKVDNAVKKPQNHLGNFDSYNIDKKSLEAVASSWTNEATVGWKQLGEQVRIMK